jgi:DNA ligase-4
MRLFIIRPPPKNLLINARLSVQWLDELAKAPAEGKEAVFNRMVNVLPPTEQKWLIRIILGDMKLPVKESKVFQWYHPDAQECFNTTMSLKAVFHDSVLYDKDSKKTYSIKIGNSFAPMAAARFLFGGGEDGANKVLDKWNDFFIERKLDGERMLVHKQGRGGTGTVKIFSKRSLDNAMYASVMIEQFQQALDDADEVILDGEMLAWDEDEQQFLSFGENKGAGADMVADPYSKRHLCYMAFDVLWLKGSKSCSEVIGDLTRYPLRQRKVFLSRILTPVEHFVEALEAYSVAKPAPQDRRAEVVKKFEEAIDRGDEGIMLKLADSPYALGERSQNWLKLKPEYTEGSCETVDTVILGGYYGSRSKHVGNKVSHFLIGVPDKNSTDDKPLFKSLAKVGTGYNYDELNHLVRNLQREDGANLTQLSRLDKVCR